MPGVGCEPEHSLARLAKQRLNRVRHRAIYASTLKMSDTIRKQTQRIVSQLRKAVITNFNLSRQEQCGRHYGNFSI